MANLPINPAMLSWAMADSGLSVSDVAALTGRLSSTVLEWLSADSKPTKGDVEKIAHRAGRSVQFFFLPQPPAPTPIAVRFRSAIEGASADPVEELRALRTAQSLQKVARWAAEADDRHPAPLPRVTDDPTAYADQMRAFLGWNTRKQIDATSKSAVFKALRAAIESLGIVVFFRPMGENNCRGFSLPDEYAPLIAINSEYKLPSLRSYTILHELAHLARGSTAICHDEDNREEQWCNQFAAAFLMPAREVRAYFKYKRWDAVRLDQIDERIRLTSKRFKASWQSVAIRLRTLGLTSQAVVDQVFAASKEHEESSGFAPGGGRTTSTIRFEEFGSTFTLAVLSLRRAERLSEIDARRYLNVNGSELSEMRLLVSGAA